MDVCLAEATSHYVHYLDTLQYAEVSNGNFTVEALPLIKPPRQSKKSFKEFFHIVPNISTEDQEVIRAVMSEDPLCISRLPNSVRPRDALGTSCHLQLVLHQHPDGSCTALKFFHSKVSIPMGLARTLCEDQVLVIDYSLAKNSDAVKKAFLYMLSQISGHHWMTQVLRQKQIQRAAHAFARGRRIMIHRNKTTKEKVTKRCFFVKRGPYLHLFLCILRKAM